ncbi:hypothetical protein ACQJBY_010623 [Aegilops geniculata]
MCTSSAPVPLRSLLPLPVSTLQPPPLPPPSLVPSLLIPDPGDLRRAGAELSLSGGGGARFDLQERENMRRGERRKERRDATMGEQGQHGLRGGHGGAEEDAGAGWG